MTNLDKMKALQHKAGIEADGIASSKTWLNIYFLLFNSLPYDINMNSLIKAIQQKIDVRADGYPWIKTWDVLYEMLIVNEQKDTINDDTMMIDTQNEVALQEMPKEVVPFAKELIKLAADQNIYVRLMNQEKANSGKNKANKDNAQTSFSIHNFGLSFNIGIFELNENGELSHLVNSPLYAKVAELGESIGLTWAGKHQEPANVPYFELRPAWAVRMAESDMVKELFRRKEANLNLLAIL